jgi:hypothetical protein
VFDLSLKQKYPGGVLLLTNEMPFFVRFEQKRGFLAPVEPHNWALVNWEKKPTFAQNPYFARTGLCQW